MKNKKEKPSVKTTQKVQIKKIRKQKVKMKSETYKKNIETYFKKHLPGETVKHPRALEYSNFKLRNPSVDQASLSQETKKKKIQFVLSQPHALGLPLPRCHDSLSRGNTVIGRGASTLGVGDQ